MSTQKPDRKGWITGPFADAPACPPFPSFTNFERCALESIAPLFGPKADAFLEQVAYAEVTDRLNTNVGFYTRVKVDRTKCSSVPLRHKGAHIEVEGIKHGMGIILWDNEGDGYLRTIEGWTADEIPLEDVNLANIKFIRLAQRD